LRARDRGFFIVCVCADITNMREGKADDLLRIRRIGQNFLIACNRGVKANLTDGAAFSSAASAIKDLTISKYKRGCWKLGHVSSFFSALADNNHCVDKRAAFRMESPDGKLKNVTW